jgi:hypothetical protein
VDDSIPVAGDVPAETEHRNKVIMDGFDVAVKAASLVG